ncbi:hypothetical protein H7J06_24610 [Mycobacterium hodleri]|uniref:hypothetical protein n=1 Tax=Mycolicibacterium hodleri TaxID=49897 RepID=UPI0021F25BE2|nr:hypothetical protein [Mycolicibacterium hodleri]MCV7136159.1 hypothetical protein [Mycolicibacterium hodleri]
MKHWPVLLGVVVAGICAWQIIHSHHPIPLLLLTMVLVAVGAVGYVLRRQRK